VSVWGDLVRTGFSASLEAPLMQIIWLSKMKWSTLIDSRLQSGTLIRDCKLTLMSDGRGPARRQVRMLAEP
jgi:hypothetical protein